MSNKKVIGNFLWRFAERCGAQLVTFIVSIVLARILAPEDYGQIALITVFTTIMQVFVDSAVEPYATIEFCTHGAVSVKARGMDCSIFSDHMYQVERS